MSLFRAVCESQQKDFEDLNQAKKFIQEFPAGTPGEISVLDARPGEVSTYCLIAGSPSTVEHVRGNKL